MTHLSVSSIFQPRRGSKPLTRVPQELDLKLLSIVVPVRNNQKGIERLLESFFEKTKEADYPAAIIIVDNNSDPEIEIAEKFRQSKRPEIKILQCKKFGPAAARNQGLRYARSQYQSQWVLFVDSDCIFTNSSIAGYRDCLNGSVAYQGFIKSVSQDWLSQYYIDEKILEPKVFNDQSLDSKKTEPFFRPNYLITANLLCSVEAVLTIGGFNENFLEAAGEDIDLGYRLMEVGQLSYSGNSSIEHDFLDGQGWVKVANITDTIKRFERYGRGNKKLGTYHNINLVPNPNKIFFKNVDDYLRYRDQIFKMNPDDSFAEPQKGFILELTMWSMFYAYQQGSYKKSEFSESTNPQEEAVKIIQSLFRSYSESRKLL